eukprot:TRINITY_DN7773_c0_g1_i1.p1 TRINITY_DN7773_c0_g1~~TRINITY_DN7773_c0_g1_i1.p1  ORF type:complete len:511 (+),score=150.86 TRINITY_DN7773_c0_g1_i1:30-1562(+)
MDEENKTDVLNESFVLIDNINEESANKENNININSTNPPNNNNNNVPNKNKGLFSMFKEQTQNFAKGLVEIVNTDGDSLFEKIRNKIAKDKNKEVRDKIENDEWNVKEIEKDTLDQGNNKVANQILDIVSADEIDLAVLKQIACQGVPPILRSTVWKILLGITPLNKAEQEKKRSELTEQYKLLLLKHYRDSQEDEHLHHQISIDCIRTSINGFQHVFENKNVVEILNRVLYIWSREYPKVNYYQGLNEILAPIIFFYLCEYVDINSANELNNISNQDLAILEIDSYFSLKQLLDWVMNDYDSTDGSVYAGGMVSEISRSVQHNIPALHNHLLKLGLDYNVLCFRWALCLLCREMNILNVGRLFDNYFSLGQSFPKLHPYVCVSILEIFVDKILPLEFSETIMVLQRLVPATFSQTRDSGQINPLIKRAIKIRERDLKNFNKVPKIIDKLHDKNTNNVIVNNNNVENNVIDVEKQKENELTTAVLVGGVVLTLFTAALLTHAGRRFLSKK